MLAAEEMPVGAMFGELGQQKKKKGGFLKTAGGIVTSLIGGGAKGAAPGGQPPVPTIMQTEPPKSAWPMIGMIGGGVILLGVAGYFLLTPAKP